MPIEGGVRKALNSPWPALAPLPLKVLLVMVRVPYVFISIWFSCLKRTVTREGNC